MLKIMAYRPDWQSAKTKKGAEGRVRIISLIRSMHLQLLRPKQQKPLRHPQWPVAPPTPLLEDGLRPAHPWRTGYCRLGRARLGGPREGVRLTPWPGRYNVSPTHQSKMIRSRMGFNKSIDQVPRLVKTRYWIRSPGTLMQKYGTSYCCIHAHGSL